MRIVASDEVRRFVRANGGDLYVWTRGHGCCSGRVTFLATDTRRPRDWSHEPEPIDAGGFRVHLRTGGRGLPGELVLELRRRRRTVDAFWDGCAFVL